MLEITLSVIQTAIVLTGAVWAYFRFYREGAHKPRVEFDVECTFLGPQQDRYVAAFVLHATNRGNVEHRFSEIRLRVLGLKSNQSLTAWKGREPRLAFPDKEFGTVNIVPEKMRPYFVRPGVHQRFSFVTSVPASWKFLIARASFKYESPADREGLHTAERAFEVRAAAAG